MLDRMMAFAQDLRTCTAVLAEQYGTVGVRLGFAERQIPRHGTVHGVEFFFHGKGLWFDLGDRLVDIDFCKEGFEADWWRFRSFVNPDSEHEAQRVRQLYLGSMGAANAQTDGFILGDRRLVFRE